MTDNSENKFGQREKSNGIREIGRVVIPSRVDPKSIATMLTTGIAIDAVPKAMVLAMCANDQHTIDSLNEETKEIILYSIQDKIVRWNEESGAGQVIDLQYDPSSIRDEIASRLYHREQSPESKPVRFVDLVDLILVGNELGTISLSEDIIALGGFCQSGVDDRRDGGVKYFSLARRITDNVLFIGTTNVPTNHSFIVAVECPSTLRHYKPTESDDFEPMGSK